MKYIFFNLYNRMYKDGTLNVQNHTEWNAYAITATATVFWFMVFYGFYFFDIKSVDIPNYFQPVSFLISFIILIVLYFNLLWNKKYEKIYNQFCHLNKTQRKVGLIISFSYFLLPIFIGAYITLKFHGKI